MSKCVTLLTFTLIHVSMSSGAAAAPATQGSAQAVMSFIEVNPDATTSLRERGRGRPFVAVGVNYFDPEVGWAPKLWQRFDEQRVRKHLDMIHAAGFNTIRVFLTYASFHSERGKVDDNGMAKLRTLLGLCRERGIYVIPTGPDHWEGTPTWTVGDRFADEATLDADDAWWRAFADLMRDETTILAYDLLNEPSVGWDTPSMRRVWEKRLEAGSDDVSLGKGLATEPATQPSDTPATRGDLLRAIPRPEPVEDSEKNPRLLAFQRVREAVADNWTRRKVAAIRSVDRNHLITIGHIQWAAPILIPGVQHYSGFNLKENAKHLDFMTIHFYPLDWPKPTDGPGGIFVNAVYLQAVLFQASVGPATPRSIGDASTTYQGFAGASKPVMLGEFGWHGGGPIVVNGRVDLPAQSPEDQLNWCKEAVNVSRGHVCGWLNWALADTPESLDLTRWSGCWTTDLQIKPWGQWFSDFAREQLRRPDPARAWPSYLQMHASNMDQMKVWPEAGNKARLQLRSATTQRAKE